MRNTLLIIFATFTLIACNGGGGGSSSGGDPIPTPTPSPATTKLKALTLTQDEINIDKVGQHRLWRLTLTNPNPVPVYLVKDANLMFFQIDPTSDVGPTNPTRYAVLGGENNCMDIINNSPTPVKEYTSKPLGAGQSCSYIFNTAWAPNESESGQTNYSFKLSYRLATESDLNIFNDPGKYIYNVKTGCVEDYLTSCATGENKAINYTLLHLDQKVNFPYSFPFLNLINPIGRTGDYIWFNVARFPDSTRVSTIGRSPVKYDTNTNTLTIESLDYQYTAWDDGWTDISPFPDYTGYISWGTDWQTSTPPDYSTWAPGWRQITGLDTRSYVKADSYGSNHITYVYPVNMSNPESIHEIVSYDPLVYADYWKYSYSESLPYPVQFKGYYSDLLSVDVNGSVFGIDMDEPDKEVQYNLGCFTKNTSGGYNNWKKMDYNGFDNYYVYNYPKTTTLTGKYYYTIAYNKYVDFRYPYNERGPVYSWFYSQNLIDVNNCQISADNYFLFFLKKNETGEFDVVTGEPPAIITEKYILVWGLSGTAYVLPIDKMSNGLDGQ